MNRSKTVLACLFIFLVFFSLEVGAGGIKANSTLTANKQGKVSKEIEKLRNLRRSQINVPKNNFEITIKIFLFAEDEKVEILKGTYCGGEEGDKQYTGNYHLISVKDNKIISKIDLGKDYEFIENALHSGLHRFVMPQTYEQLLMIYQYGSCNIERVEFYRVDVEGHLYKVSFIDKDGVVATGQTTGPDGGISGTEADLTFCSYNNGVGYFFCDSYTYNGNNFIQTASWMSQREEEMTISALKSSLEIAAASSLFRAALSIFSKWYLIQRFLTDSATVIRSFL